MKAVRQIVHEEAADELVRIERHQLGRVAAAIITPAEGYAGLVGADQAAVGDGNPPLMVCQANHCRAVR